MKRLMLPGTLVLAAFFAFAPAVRAEILYTEETLARGGMMGQPPVTHTVKTWYADAKIRKEDPNQIQLIDLDNSTMYLLKPQDKTYTVFEGEMFKNMTKNASAFLMAPQVTPGADRQIPDNLYEKTGETKTIGDWKCYQVKVHYQGPMMGNANISQWWSKDIKIGKDAYLKNYKKLLGGSDPAFEKVYKQIEELDGYPVQTETSFKMGTFDVTTTQTLTKVEKMKNSGVAKDFFEIPKGYTKSEFMPFNQMQQGQAGQPGQQPQPSGSPQAFPTMDPQQAQEMLKKLQEAMKQAQPAK